MRIFVLLIIWLTAIVLLSYFCFITKSNNIRDTKSVEVTIDNDINTTDNSTINIVTPNITTLAKELNQSIEIEEEIKITPRPKIILDVEDERDSNLTEENLDDTNNSILQEIEVDKSVLCENRFNSLLLNEKVHFDKNRFNIKDSSYELLDKLIDISKECSESKIVIEGYTDTRGSIKINRKISLKRANAVKSYFIKGGISSERLKAIGYGEIKPIATNSTAKGREKNRRIEIHIKEGVKVE